MISRKLIISGLLMATAVLLAGFFSGGRVEKKPEVIKNQGTIDLQPTEIAEKIVWDGEVGSGEDSYVYLIRDSINPADLKLIPNYELKKFTKQLISESNCRLLVNGGFYETDFSPLGLVVIDGGEISRKKTSSLFNGFVYLDQTKNIFFSKSEPTEEVIYALQTGPVLIADGRVQELSMARDRNSRRLVMAEDTDGKIIFMAFFKKISDRLGPVLAELPELVAKVGKQRQIDFSFALNLDGGSASVFWDENVFLEDSNTVGSWWCVADR